MKRVILNETYRIDFARHEIKDLRDGSVKSLEPRLAQVLRMLVDKEGQVVPRKELVEGIWGNYASGDESLTHSICLIRNTLDKSIILTVPKSGYVLLADVAFDNGYANKVLKKLTFKRVAAAFIVLMVLKMILFPHH